VANYIHTLQAENARLAQTEERVAEMRAHLATPKFHAEQANGDRGDWMATADILRWLTYITEI